MPYMSGSTIKSQPYESLKKEILTNDISKWMSPPYDLIKCDIEGQSGTTQSYDELVSQTNILLECTVGIMVVVVYSNYK